MTESHLWYDNLNSLLHSLAVSHNLTIEKVAGIFVTFSAQKDFAINLNQTIEFLDGRPITGMYSGKQLSTANRILAGEDPLNVWAKESLKYRNFYYSILLQDGAVCVDTHIIRYYLKLHPYSKLHRLDLEAIFKRKWAYVTIQRYVRRVSVQMGIKTYQAQAYIWVVQRGAMW